jgi:hypothetical protein
VLEHLAADDEIGRPLRDVRLGDVSDQDLVAHLRRRELARGRAEVDPLDLDPELGEEEHQEPGPAADVQHAPGREDIPDQRRVAVLDSAARLQLVAVALLAPVGGEVLVVVVLGGHPLLGEHRLLEGLHVVEERAVRGGFRGHRHPGERSGTLRFR